MTKVDLERELACHPARRACDRVAAERVADVRLETLSEGRCVYLGDPRRVEPSMLRTIVRQPVSSG